MMGEDRGGKSLILLQVLWGTGVYLRVPVVATGEGALVCDSGRDDSGFAHGVP